jgi:hypothetical protein
MEPKKGDEHLHHPVCEVCQKEFDPVSVSIILGGFLALSKPIGEILFGDSKIPSWGQFSNRDTQFTSKSN